VYDEITNTRRRPTLLAEIDTAEAMLALVKACREAPQERREYQTNAFKIYQTCLVRILPIAMSASQEYEMWNRLAALRHRLESDGLLKR
jgi:glucokinase